MNPIRALAKSNYHQTLYSKVKDLGLELFENKKDLTAIQLAYLNWLETYSVIFRDIALEEPFAKDDLLEDDLLCDSYLVYRRKKPNKKEKPNNAMNDCSVQFT